MCSFNITLEKFNHELRAVELYKVIQEELPPLTEIISDDNSKYVALPESIKHKLKISLRNSYKNAWLC
jgi:hypothetical protein